MQNKFKIMISYRHCLTTMQSQVRLRGRAQRCPKWWNTRYAGTSPKATDSLGYIRAKITRNGWSGYVSSP